MKISIVTISYNQARYIEATIQSVLKQTYSDVEYIVIDGGSTDGTTEIMKRYVESIAYYVSEKDEGPGDALNKGFRAATGDFVMYLNSDDLLEQDAVEKVVKVIEKAPKYDVYYGHGRMQFDHDGSLLDVYSDKWDINMYRHGLVSVFQQSTAIRRESWLLTKGFNTINFDNWDGELLVDLYLAGARFYRYDGTVGIFRMYNESISGSDGNSERYSKTKQRISDKVLAQEKLQDQNHFVMKLKRTLTDPLIAFKKALASRKVATKMRQMRVGE